MVLFGRPLQLISAESTELFVGRREAPLQVVRIRYTGGQEPTGVRVEARDGRDGHAVQTPEPVRAEPAPGEGVLEVPVATPGATPGQRIPAAVVAGRARLNFELTVAEPGWTMFMISHFHYDPVWWTTQAAYTSSWQAPPGPARQQHGFDLVRAHLEFARREPEYKFVLAEVDYLKPYWDTHPEDRVDLRRLIHEGRVEIMGGAYNEPNTNLTGPETTIRNLVHGMAFQRDVLGADPATAWQLDAFGHDPAFPGMAADVGLTSSSWARGPHHQWGPMQVLAGVRGDPERMQFRSEFEWISPSGRGLLTSYMPGHYSAGWWMDASPTLSDAEEATYQLFLALKKVSTTRNVLLPVGTDYTPPNKWVTRIHRDWNARYAWPRFVCALPREFFTAVRAELGQRGLQPSPQTRDMNPIYTGKDVSFIDTKQANRAAEHAVLHAERFAAFAGVLTGAPYPQAALAKAWVQLAYGAHHDAITGSESDQVYLDLLTSWRDAWQLGSTARDNALRLLSSTVDTSAAASVLPGNALRVIVWNPLPHDRTDVVTVRVEKPFSEGVRVRDTDGVDLPAVVEHGGRSVSFIARDVPSLGWREFRLVPAFVEPGWQEARGAHGAHATEIINEHYRLRVDPSRGGGVASLVEQPSGRELIAEGEIGNELVVYDEYPQHPHFAEGPWHLVPRGPVIGSSGGPAESVRTYRSPIGERLVITGRIGRQLRYTQTITLWHAVPRVDCSTTIDEFDGADRLVRLRWPCPVPGAMPVSEVGDAVVARGFGLLHDPVTGRSVDTAEHPWTLDNPAYTWFGLSSSARIRVGAAVRSIAVAEVVSPSEHACGPMARGLLVALVRAGVTATCSTPDRPRYGHLAVDSNLPDVRIALGGPARNAFTAKVLADAGSEYTAELERQLNATGRARMWVPAAAPLAVEWVPGADLRYLRALPVLVLAGRDEAALGAAVAAVIDDLADAEVLVSQDAPVGDVSTAGAPHSVVFDQRTVALLNRGMPGFAVEADGTLHASLMRSCTGWPSGMWTDPPRRTAPDGSNFQLQHWTHRFEYALASGPGDWRQAAIPTRSAEFSHPLLAVAATGEHSTNDGPLPASGSLLRVDPAGHGTLGDVQLGALKATGNPLVRGSAAQADPRASVTLRLVEGRGTSTTAVVRAPLGRLTQAARADLLERPRQPLPVESGRIRVDLHGYEIATVLVRLDLRRVTEASGGGAGGGARSGAARSGAARSGAGLAPEAEAVQPLYARYWLHNRGPAPLGGLPAVGYLHPHRVTAAPGADVTLRLTVASDRTDGPLRGAIRLVGPDRWSAAPDDLPFELPPGGHASREVLLRVPADAAPGRYPVRAQLRLDADHLPPSWRQVVEDVCLVSVGTASAPARGDMLRLDREPDPVTVAPGGSARLAVTVATDAHADLAVEAHVISPWGTWEWIGPPAVGAELPAEGKVELSFDVAPPRWAEPGRWWALIRVAAAGHLVYTQAVPVEVRS
ncbi:MAG TPA: NEW3 domain-containing protein [Pseudonocardiaceae bacterium]